MLLSVFAAKRRRRVREGVSDSRGLAEFLAFDSSVARDKSQHFCITRKSHKMLQHSGTVEGGGVSLKTVSDSTLDTCSDYVRGAYSLGFSKDKVVPLHLPDHHVCEEGTDVCAEVCWL